MASRSQSECHIYNISGMRMRIKTIIIAAQRRSIGLVAKDETEEMN